MRYRLRTLLILMALGPPLLAAGYWAWERFKSKPPPSSPWYIYENVQYFPPPHTPGYSWKLSRQGLIEVPEESGDP